MYMRWFLKCVLIFTCAIAGSITKSLYFREFNSAAVIAITVTIGSLIMTVRMCNALNARVISGWTNIFLWVPTAIQLVLIILAFFDIAKLFFLSCWYVASFTLFIIQFLAVQKINTSTLK